MDNEQEKTFACLYPDPCQNNDSMQNVKATTVSTQWNQLIVLPFRVTLTDWEMG